MWGRAEARGGPVSGRARGAGWGTSRPTLSAYEHSKVDPGTAGRVPDLARIVAFRNVLVHGYAQIDDALVWEVASARVPELTAVPTALLDDA